MKVSNHLRFPLVATALMLAPLLVHAEPRSDSKYGVAECSFDDPGQNKSCYARILTCSDRDRDGHDGLDDENEPTREVALLDEDGGRERDRDRDKCAKKLKLVCGDTVVFYGRYHYKKLDRDLVEFEGLPNSKYSMTPTIRMEKSHSGRDIVDAWLDFGAINGREGQCEIRKERDHRRRPAAILGLEEAIAD